MSDHNHVSTLPYAGLIWVHGKEAENFLQGQLTCHMAEIRQGKVTLAAHCLPNGRIVSLFLIMACQDGFLLNLPQCMCATTIKALQKTVIFFRTVQIEEISAKHGVKLISGGEQIEMYRHVILDKFASLYGMRPALDAAFHWKYHSLKAMAPMVYPETSEKFLPHDVGLIQFGGVSFNKGCYVGQEIIARMEHRGRLKKHTVLAQVAKPFHPGTKLHINNHVLATVIDTVTYQDTVMALCVSELTMPEDGSLLNLQRAEEKEG